jgi:hypothetical protein
MALGTNPDPIDPKQLVLLTEQYVQLLMQARNLTEADARNLANSAAQAKILNASIKAVREELNDTVFVSDSLAKSFRETLAELKNQNVTLQIGKGIFKDLTNVAQDLTYFQRGIIDLEDKHFRKKQQTLDINQDNLENIQKTLGKLNAQTNEYEFLIGKEKTLIQLQALKAQKGIKLTENQTRLLKQLEKEKDLLNAANIALDEGLPALQRELDVSKQIYDIREDLGGLAGAAASTISQYGGDLARFLKIDDALEATKKYNQDIINDALTRKDVLQQIQDFEQQRLNAQKQSIDIQTDIGVLENKSLRVANLISAIRNKTNKGAFDAARIAKLQATQNNINAQIQQKELDLINQTKSEKGIIADIDRKEAAYKLAVIDSTNRGLTGFINRFKSLGVLVQNLGAGLKKALTDPITIITFFIGKALEANKQAVEIGKSLGISGDAASRLRDNYVAYAAASNDNFITQTRLTKAQNDLAAATGMTVAFREEDLATFSRLTELQGLSNEEGAKLLRIASVTGKDYKKYLNDVAKSAYYASVNTKQNITSKEALQAISKLSAGILVKFRGNTDALVSAVAEAKKLGLTLDQIDKVGESLLNWEQSIENELKAELLTGRQINLERARYAALTGDQLTLTREITSQVGTLAEYEGMNVLAQRSLAEAFGLTRDEMSDMLLQQELINKYGDKAVKLTEKQREEFLAAQKAKPNLTLGQFLNEQQQQLDIQTKFNNAIIKLQELIGGLVDGPLSRLLDNLTNGLNIVTKVFGVFGQIGASIKSLFGDRIGGLLGDAASIASIGALMMLVTSSLTKGTILNPMVTVPLGGVTGMAGRAGKLFGTAGASAGKSIVAPVKAAYLRRFAPTTGPLAYTKPALPKFNAAANRWMMNVPKVGNRIISTPTIAPARVGFLTKLSNIGSQFTKGLSTIFKPVLSLFSGFGRIIGGFGRAIGTGGALAGIFGFATGFAKKKEEGGTTGEAVGAGGVRGGAAIAGSVVGAALGSLIAPGIGTAIGGIIGGFVGDSLGGWINKNAPGVAKRFGTFWDSTVSKLSGAFDAIKEMFKVWGKALDSFYEPIGGLAGAAEVLGDTLLVPIKLITTAFGFLGDMLKGIAQIFSGNWKEGFKTLGVGFVDLIKGLFTSIFDPLITLFNKYFGTEEEQKEANKKEAETAVNEGTKLIGQDKFNKLVKEKSDIGWFKGALDQIEALVKNPTEDYETRQKDLKVFRQQRAEVEALDQIKYQNSLKNKRPESLTEQMGSSYVGLADGGEVLKTGIAQVDKGEVYLGKSTRETFRILAANSIAQTQHLKELIAVFPLNTLNITPAVDAINNLATKITNLIKPAPTPIATIPTIPAVNFDTKPFNDAVNKLLTTPLSINIQPLIEAIKGINMPPISVTSNVNVPKIDFTPLIDAIKGISIPTINIASSVNMPAPTINVPKIDFSPLIDAIKGINISATIASNIKIDFTPLIDAIKGIAFNPTITNQIDFTPVVDAIRKINIAPPQFNVSADVEVPQITLPANEQPRTAIPQPVPQSPLPLISDTLKQIVGASSPKAVEQRPATTQQTINNSNDTKSVVAAINALQNRPTVVKLYLDSKQVIEMMAKGNSSLA